MERLEKLIVDMRESLEREIRGIPDGIRQEMRRGFDRLDARFAEQALRMEQQIDQLAECIGTLRKDKGTP
jgi:hypothetical protein